MLFRSGKGKRIPGTQGKGWRGQGVERRLGLPESRRDRRRHRAAVGEEKSSPELEREGGLSSAGKEGSGHALNRHMEELNSDDRSFAMDGIVAAFRRLTEAARSCGTSGRTLQRVHASGGELPGARGQAIARWRGAPVSGNAWSTIMACSGRGDRKSVV